MNAPHWRHHPLLLAAPLWAVVACSPAEPPGETAVEHVVVEAGTFVLGSPSGELCRDEDEARRVATLTQAFRLTRTETTQEAFAATMGYNPSFVRGCPTCPVERVTWHEAAAYCNALSRRAKLPTCYRCEGTGERSRCELVETYACEGWRLPTEAEWEVAARAGRQTALHGGPISVCMVDDPVADASSWYKANSGGRTRPVATRHPNALGLFDMEGNVYEWVQDAYTPRPPTRVTDPLHAPAGASAPRVFRGGSFYHNVEHARSANRDRFDPEARLTWVGFRCAQTVARAERAGGGEQ